MGGDEDVSGGPGGPRKMFWRSASWSASRTGAADHGGPAASGGGAAGQPRRCPAPPLTPRSQSYKSRSCLPPLQPLSIARRSLDEWPCPGSDDIGEWPLQPPTPSSSGLSIDLSKLGPVHPMKDQLASFDKECSKVADHIYLGGDSVARNLNILRENGITHVLNCVGFVCPEYFRSEFTYKTLWLQDTPSEDITSILYDVFDYFEDVRQNDGRVFVHCCQGVSRSTSLVIAYLMWRKGQSFDDAFQFVKAARRIANPNMGFACQLLQCQKRVHAIPLSPTSVVRLYRMAPHSPYDALHLVPKLLTEPSPTALDSRGAFILHVLSSIFVWIGLSCEAVMEKDAKAAAFQVVKYEKVSGPIVSIKEGHEPPDFWVAFSSAQLASDSASKVKEEDAGSESKTGGTAGKRRVAAYDADFELFYKAIAGGVVPPFPSSGPGNETHLPMRESNWSLLRRKLIPNNFSRVCSDSALMKDADPRVNRIQLLTAESLASSPSSLSSDSSSCSKSVSGSPSLSPSTSSSPGLTPSPPSDSSVPSSIHPSHPSSSLEPFKPLLRTVSSPSKGFSCSIAERRGSFSPLKLPALTTDSSLLAGKVTHGSSSYHATPSDILGRSNANLIRDVNVLDSNSIGQIPPFKSKGESADGKLENCVHPRGFSTSENSPLLSGSNGLADVESKLQPAVYRYPEMKKIETVGREDIDSESVFLFVTSNKGDVGQCSRILYIWIGSGLKHNDDQNHLKSDVGVNEVSQIDWNRVGCDFLAAMGLPKNLPVKVVEGQEPEKFLELLS